MPIKYCVECGKPFTRQNSLDLCERCWPFNYDPELFLENLELDIEEERTLKTELGMPADANASTVPMSGALVNENWRGYHFEMFGIVVSPIPAETPSGYLIYFTDSDITHAESLVQVWQHKVTHDATRVYGEVRWHPERGEHIAIKGLEHSTSKIEINLIWKGIRLLPQVRERVQRGRPIGSASFTREKFLECSVKAYRKVAALGKRPTQYDIAALLGIVRATFSRYLKIHRISWKAIREEATKT